MSHSHIPASIASAEIVREWRREVQNTLLRPREPNSCTLGIYDQVDSVFKKLEAFDGMTHDILQFSKIGRIMRHIASNSCHHVPKDVPAQYEFQRRALRLYTKWRLLPLENQAPATQPIPHPSTSTTGAPTMVSVPGADAANTSINEQSS